MPVCFLYFTIFRKIVFTKIEVENRVERELENRLEGDLLEKHKKQRSMVEIENKESKMNSNMDWGNIKNCFHHVGSYIINLSLVYYLEYCCLVSFADRANPPTIGEGYLRDNAIANLSMVYQIGVFLARSSLPLFKIEKVSLITFGQFIVYLIYFSVAVHKWMIIEHQLILMFVCGIFGGLSFGNCHYLLLKNDTLEKSQKEVAIGIMGVFSESGILIASLFALFISNYVIKN